MQLAEAKVAAVARAHHEYHGWSTGSSHDNDDSILSRADKAKAEQMFRVRYRIQGA